MLIKDYDLEMITPPCDPSSQRFTAIARLMIDISDVLPYLNATLRGAAYNDAVPALIWTKAARRLAFHPYKIAVSNLEDRAAAEEEVERAIALVNRTWDRRDRIEPDHATLQRPGHLDVYRGLPQTNCGQCGQPTCYTFALKLAAGQLTLDDCPVIHDPEYAGELAELQALVGGAAPAIRLRDTQES